MKEIIKTHDKAKTSGHVKLTFENVETGKIEVFEYDNVVCNPGMESRAQRAAGGSLNNVGQISYCAVGTDVTTPTAADTDLGTEIYRKQISNRSSTGNVANFRTFFTTSEANGVLKEVGLFGDDASSTADSGVLYAKRAIDRTKTSAETLTVDWDITFI